MLPKSASPVRPKSQGHDEIERPLPEDDAPHSAKLPKAVKRLLDEPEQTSAPQRVFFPRAETDLPGMAEPERVMLAWTALEVLSPQSFLKPEDLAGGERNRITRLDGADLLPGDISFHPIFFRSLKPVRCSGLIQHLVKVE